MTDFRQKEESVPSAASGATSPNAGFRRDLEELVLGHIDGCKTYAAACSSGRDDIEDDGESVSGEGSDQLVRRRRRSDLEGGDLAESSAVRRRHSRILSRWVARQAEDMITTIERRNRESELMALAGLQTVSMLDSSFLRESISVTPDQSVDRPAVPRSSSILRRWREIEDESARSPRRSVAQNRDDRDPILDSRVSTSGSDENDYGHWSHQSIGTSREQREHDDGGGRSTRDQSPDSVDGERERVRQIARGWMNERGMMDRGGSEVSVLGNETQSQRAEWLGETERERVRLVREWVQMTIQERDTRDRGSHDDSITDHEDGPPEHVRRDLLRIRGRQARLELVMRMARERQSELDDLSENRAVSDFAHRNRIQVNMFCGNHNRT